MENGTIVESGTHDELLAVGEKYIEMIRLFEKTTMKSTVKKSEIGYSFDSKLHTLCVLFYL